MRPLSVRSDHRARPAPRLAPVILLMGLALVALAAPAPAEINFDAPFLAKGNGYVNRYLTVADFNGDGHPDVATGVFTDNSIHILLGRGDGTFTIGTPVPMSLSFGYLEAGDVNGDGFADIVTSNTGANVSVFLGHGDGTFGPRTDYATPASGTNRIMKIEDLNLDGIPDLIVSNSVFRGQLGSTLGTRIDLPFSPFAVGDMNGDGKPDLLTGGSDGVFCRLGHGDFTFDPPTTVFVPTYPTSVSQVQAADVNGDGKLDAVFLHSGTSSGTFAVCLGHGDGTFGPVAEFPCSQPPSRAITGDFNGDGRADVAAIVVPPNWGRMYRLGQPDGSLGPEQVFADGFELWGIETADVNGDGRDDVLSASSIGGSVCVALGNADGTLGHLSEYSTGMFSYGVLAGDLNGDGHPDAIVAESDSDSVAVLFGDCAAHLGAPLHLHSGFSSPSAAALGDLDGDGRLDLILGRSSHPDSSPDSTVAFLGGNGDGTFRASILTHAGVQAGAIKIINVNGDAFPDLAVFRNSDVAVLRGNGDGTFGTPIVMSTAPRHPFFADLDGDGITDLIEVGSDPVVVEFGAGDGTFSSPITISSSGATSATAGDLDGDGNADLVFTTDGPPELVSVWRGLGGHAFMPGASYVLPNSARLIGLVDFDHDGRLDLAFRTGADALQVLAGNGDATFSSLPAAFGLGMDVSEIDFADLDGDGGPEVLTAEGGPRAVSVIRNRSTLGSTAVPVTRLPAGTSLVRVTPNPAAGDRLSVSFALAGWEPARLEVFDIAGRRLRSLDVTKFGPGLHEVDLASGRRFAPGLYVLRLSQNGKEWTARAAVVQ